MISLNPHLKKVYDFLVQAEPDDMIPACDAIFVFGTTNGDVAKHAALLYHQKKAHRIIISGKYGVIRTEGPSGFDSEAEYLGFVAEGDGVPKEALILERDATNTYENVVFGMRACKEARFNPKTLDPGCNALFTSESTSMLREELPRDKNIWKRHSGYRRFLYTLPYQENKRGAAASD